MKKLLMGITGFLILDLYFNLVPMQVNSPYLKLPLILLFFPLAAWTAKWVGLDGLKGLGISFHPGWKKNFILSLLVGFSFWALMYGIRMMDGRLEFIGARPLSETIMSLLEVLVGFFLGSLINDIIVRGYIVNILKDKLHIGFVFFISIAIYALEDSWYAGLSWDNIVFSVILGFSLTLAYYKTGSIWGDTGLHFGLNLAYGFIYGLSGKAGSGVLAFRELGRGSWLSENIQYIMPLLMFLFMLWFLRFYKQQSANTEKEVPFSL